MSKIKKIIDTIAIHLKVHLEQWKVKRRVKKAFANIDK
jgi:hypothetical protein